MKKTALSLVALLVGAACAVFLLGLWRTGQPAPRSPRAAPPAEAAAAPAASAPRADPDAFSRVLLAQLDRLLTRADARAHEAVLTFKDDEAYRRFLARAKKSGLTILGQLNALRSVRVGYDQLSSLRTDLLANPDDFSGVAANNLLTIPGPPAKDDRAAIDAVPFGNRALEFLGVDLLSASRATWGQGVTIAVLDTGIAPDRTFGDYRVRTLDIGLGVAAGTGSDDGHGTAVASVAAGAAADAPGVAPAASLLSIRVTDASGASDLFTIAQAILAATDAGAKVINISLGGYATNTTLSAAIGYAQDHGAVIVAAAGNDQAAQLAWPAADARVVSVGAVDAAEQQVTFSNSGPQLQITAPGYGVQTAWLNGQRATVDGTSISAPLVSGAIAAVLSQNPSLTAQQAWATLQQTTNDAGAPGDDPDYGHGILNVGWALNANNPARIDTAVSSHYYDAANQQMDFVVQNRSALAITGLSLAIDAAGSGSTQLIPPLAAGATYVVKLPVDPTQLAAAGSLKFVTQLVNPTGVIDAVPANNRRSSILSAPAK
jgi:hypothetical protein